MHMILRKFVVHFQIIIHRWVLRRSLTLGRFFMSKEILHVFEPFERFDRIHRSLSTPQCCIYRTALRFCGSNGTLEGKLDFSKNFADFVATRFRGGRTLSWI